MGCAGTTSLRGFTELAFCPIAVVVRSKTWVCSAYLDCGFESRQGHGCLLVVTILCSNVELSATGRSLVQRSPTKYVCVLARARVCR